ncbi:UNVERIFIED_CONTAM: hypothetical protein Sradi_6170600 [Sesamum radiatum]|uniref:Uncharacterized protein n=1 Tax=Sesamum radiatum TaxID=300843 RepID=A0AAW2KAZ3_SESRA
MIPCVSANGEALRAAQDNPESQSYHYLSKKLGGTLSPAIANLTFLRVVDPRGNIFRGPIPTEIGHLFRLQSLLLMDNNLGGKIPVNLSQCILIFAFDFRGSWGNFRGM